MERRPLSTRIVAPPPDHGMSSRSQFLVRIAAAASIALIAAGCSGFGDITRGENPIPQIRIPFLSDERPEEIREVVPAGRLYNEGLTLLGSGRFRQAAQRFEEVDRSHPHSEWARRSLLMIAYARYQAADYDEAATAADRFISLHPNAEETPYAKFLLGDSHFRMIPDVARDQARAERALVARQDVVQRHPNTEYARAAQQRILVARDQLAGKEMDVGRFYLRQRAFAAALGRFRGVVQQYQNTRHVEEALYRLVETNLALGIAQEAQAAAAVLGHNFPDSQWYRDAFTLLQRGGLSPEANERSWLARIFRS
jgi:outer membrane protein assembly factor BamD